MAKKTSLKAAIRARTGSGLNQMRREGWLPSVIYGRGTDNKNLKVDAKSFSDLLAKSSSDNIVINLEIDGEGTRLASFKPSNTMPSPARQCMRISSRSTKIPKSPPISPPTSMASHPV